MLAWIPQQPAQQPAQQRRSTGRGKRTEFGGRQDPFVEQDDARTEEDPQSNVKGRMKTASGAWRWLRRLGNTGLKFPVLFGGGAFASHCRVSAPVARKRGSVVNGVDSKIRLDAYADVRRETGAERSVDGGGREVLLTSRVATGR